MILEILGPLLFIFIFSFSVIFTLKKKMGCIPEKQNRNKLFRQGFIFIFLGIAYNLIYSYIENSNLVFWGWNLLMFIGFGHFFCYLSFKLVRWKRIVVSLIIIIITPYIREPLYLGKDSCEICFVLHYILVSPNPIYPFLPFASLWFLTTVFAELVYELSLLESKIANLKATQSLIKNGFILIIISFLYSTVQFLPFINPFTFDPSSYPFIDALPILRGTSIIYIPGLPEPLVKGTLQNILFILGFSLLIFGLIYYLIKIKNIKSKLLKFIQLYGKTGITLLFLQWVFLLIFSQSLPIYLFLLISMIYITLFGLLMSLWKKYIDLKFSLEWFIKKGSKKAFNEIL